MFWLRTNMLGGPGGDSQISWFINDTPYRAYVHFNIDWYDYTSDLQNDGSTYDTEILDPGERFSTFNKIYSASHVVYEWQYAGVDYEIPPTPPQASPPSANIWADSTNLQVGQTTTIHANYSPGANDSLTNTNIDSPEGTGLQDGTLATTRDQSFTASAPGDYTFYARIATTNYGWATYGTVGIHVDSAPPPPPPPAPPSASMGADSSTIQVGQSTTIHASFAAGANDSLSNTNIDQPEGTGVQDGSTAPTNRDYTFTPSAPGNYTFFARINTPNFGWATYASTTITVTNTPLSFSFANTAFTYDGNPHGPTVTPSDPNASYSTSGTTSAIDAGSYSLSAFGTGRFSGSGSTGWIIYPAGQSISLNPLGATIVQGQSVTFTVTGGRNGYVWGGAASGSGSSQTVTFTGAGTYNVTVYSQGAGNYDQSNTETATITVNQNTFYLAANMSGAGSVSGGGTYNENDTAVVNAVPSSGWRFTNWSGDLSGTINPASVAMDRNKSVTANFTQDNFRLTVNAGPGGNASGSANGLAGNASPPVTATPNYGFGFVKWTGDAVGGAATPMTNVPMNNSDRTVTANFYPLAPANLTITGNGNFGSAYRDANAGTPTSTSRVFLLTNSGQMPLTISSISAGTPFTVASGLTLPATVNGGSSTTVTVVFTPASQIGNATGALVVSSSGGNVSVPLSGIGLAPTIGISWR